MLRREAQAAAEKALPTAPEATRFPPAPPNARLAVIELKQRSLQMLHSDLILRNPLRSLEGTAENLLTPGGFGAVLARAGVGKTAFMVQLALYSLLQERNVLHISLDDSVKKVRLWYEEVFRAVAESYERPQIQAVWDAALPHRFIMTFKVEGFSVPKLQERLTDLTEQGIFSPQVILIDGLPFTDGSRDTLQGLRDLAGRYGVPVWFTITIHRHEEPGEDGLPVQLAEVRDLFETALVLLPDGKDIHVQRLLGASPEAGNSPLVLDPSTMLLRER